ncbi:Hypothetical protein PHPALM_20442 [Phytophthora palmivora]|uniref:Reverse transcriptase domain-containing protein n=1 Tax=Phytophthora palmivora TaxID=4796 RepID=A0A2P4XEV6_9STRA|nr:Hypothetical protein PHPALM_20442 [Phytophthora palmivora]
MAAEKDDDAGIIAAAAVPERVVKDAVPLSSGRTIAARRRRRRAEQEVAAARDILTTEFRVKREERAKVLRVAVRQKIDELRETDDLRVSRRQRREAQKAAAVARKQELEAQLTVHGRGGNRVPTATGKAVDARPTSPRKLSEDEWQKKVARCEHEAPNNLTEIYSLAEIRAERRRAVKAAKRFRTAKRLWRLQQKQGQQQSAVDERASEQPKKRAPQRRKTKAYQYERQGCYGDVELRKDDGGHYLRVAQLRAVGTSAPICLPTALLALTKKHVQEVRLDSCAQYSVAGEELRKYGRCLTGNAAVDILEGFRGGTSRVLGVWRFLGTTRYQQRITINTLLVEGQGDELLVGDDWMMDFGTRELTYIDVQGQKVILPFTCHGVSTLPQLDQPRKAVVRLAKTRKLGTNTYNIVKLHVDAEDGTTGIFMPKPCSKRHLLLAPTVDIVWHGTVSAQVLNVESRREKLPAREALGTWKPVKEDMELLAVNGELERERVAAWVSKLKKEYAEPLTDEEKLDISEMEQEDRDLVIALLRQYSGIVEKKTGCPPLARVNVEHNINTGDAAPIMLRRRHAVAENTLIYKEVDDMLQQGVIEPGQGAWGFPVVIVRKKDESVRFCIDYRALNAVTLKDVYPLPRVDETLEALLGSQRFSSLDLHSGYWQLGVAASDKPKTAFTTRRGLFQYTRMPFGLCNAPSTFQRLLDCVLRGLTWVCCLVYLDDVIIFTKGSVAQHVVELAIVLERLSEAGLSLKVSKCAFATTRMEYLVLDLTPEGIKPTE